MPASRRRGGRAGSRAGPLAAVALFLAGCGTASQEFELSAPGRWLRDYLRFDTSNPPGSELRAVQYLAGLLREAGAEVEILTTPAGRSSLWAAVGPADGETLLLLSHVDVVPAGEGWSVPPFAGTVQDGEIWGRGAIDAKGLGVTHLAALIAAARAPGPLQRRVALFAASDEELGGGQGTAWWIEHRPDLFTGVRGVLAEGGTNRVGIDAIAWWGIEVAQKRPLWLEACAEAPEELVRGLARTLARPHVWHVCEPVRSFFRSLRELDAQGRGFDPDASIGPTGPRAPLRPGMEGFFLDSLQVNAFSRRGELTCAAIDARLLPDSDEAKTLAEVRQALGPTVEVEVRLAGPASAASTVDDALFRILATELAAWAPVVPYFIAGVTDARFLRARGVPAYGFSPFLLDGAHSRSVHAADERLPLAELDAGVERMTRVVLAWASRPTLEPPAGTGASSPSGP